jgi:2-deoxy-D-gluconate 3-dehydrogenase
MFDLGGKIALVTGGNGGIGLGIAIGLGRAGAFVVVVGRNAPKSAKAVARLKSLGIQAEAVEADVTSEKAVQRLFRHVEAHHRQLDILVNNAGGTVRKQPEHLSLEEWRQVLDQNVTSAFLCSREAHPLLKKSGAGKVINIGSMLSLFGAPYAAAYGASKGGVVQLTRSLATAWGKDDIQVNAILPGWIDTDLTRTAREQVPGLYDKVLARTPAGRWGEPKDIAGLAVFLASSESDFITGAAIPVDGGYSVA